jgi:hypothetical protein
MRTTRIMEKIMSKTITAALIAAAVLGSAPSVLGAPRHVEHRQAAKTDRWFQPIHLDDPSVPAKQYFQELQTDGGGGGR